jgi:hypothetical protein
MLYEDFSRLDELRDSVKSWEEWDTLTALANYHSVVEKLFGFLKEDLTKVWLAVDLLALLSKFPGPIQPCHCHGDIRENVAGCFYNFSTDDPHLVRL